MRLTQLHPQLRTPAVLGLRSPVETDFRRRIGRLQRKSFPARTRPGVRRERVAVPGGCVATVFTPDHAEGSALLWIHGGGYVIGSTRQDDARCAAIAHETGAVVVSAEYRLAPESPFPAALDDCAAAWSWLLAAASERGLDTQRLAIGGHSAGGGLAAGLVQRLHDVGGGPCAQWLFSPMLDDRTAADEGLDTANHLIWNNRANRVGWSAYLGRRPGATSVPAYAVPGRRTDLRGLPPTWISYGDIELFADEDHAYAEALRASQVTVTELIQPGAPHGFESVAPRSGVVRAYQRRANEWLRARLREGP